jgi:hypothetical protein
VQLPICSAGQTTGIGGAAAEERDAGTALIKFLASPAASAAITQSGVEPIPANASRAQKPGYFTRIGLSFNPLLS